LDARRLGAALGQPTLGLFHLVPARVTGYFSGLVGVGMPASRTAPGRQFPVHIGSRLGNPDQATTDVPAGALALVRSLVQPVTDHIQRGALRDEAYRAGSLSESLHMGMELHDRVLQDLAYSQLQIEQLRQTLAGADADLDQARSVLEHLDEHLRETSEDARQLSLGATVDVSMPFPELIASIVQRFRRRCPLTVRRVTEGKHRELGPKVTAQVARILQEALNNVWKHAQATAVVIELNYQPDCLKLVVCDDGQGFDSKTEEIGHLGLRGIHRRVRELGGSARITSGPGRGTCIEVNIPG
jgi:signal transduction histidine kinase